MDELLGDQVMHAVSHFWSTRTRQGARQGEQSGRRDYGERSNVTGGKQLDGFVQLIRNLFREAGLTEKHVLVERRQTILPGFFRPSKEWDIVVVVDGKLAASLEFKSQIGPSFGNNFNNRSEEAIGSAHDLWVAFREGAFQSSPRPWLGYLMLLEDCPASRRPVKVEEPHFHAFPEFKGSSYAKRYELLCRRLVRERLYDAACLLMTDREAGAQGQFNEPASDLSIRRFAASLFGHAKAIACG